MSKRWSAQLLCYAFLTIRSQLGMEAFLSIMLIDYNVPRTKSLGLSLTRILCIILTMRISNLWAFWTSTQELSSSGWIMFLIFFMIPVLTTWRKTFFRLSYLHRYNTRGSNFNFHVPRIKTHSSGSFFYNAIANWNRLPDDIKSISLKSVFKRSVKTHLLNHMDV